MPNINWGGDAAGAPFTSRLDDESGNLILAETDTGTGLFEWDGSAWQFRGPVEMNGEDVSGIGSLTATSGNFDSVNTEEASIGNADVGVVLEDYTITASEDDNVLTLDFDPAIEQHEPAVVLDVILRPDESGETELQFNQKTDDEYEYWDVSGTHQTGQSGVLLCDMDNTEEFRQRLTFTRSSREAAGIDMVGGRGGSINDFAVFGARQSGFGDIDTVEIVFPGTSVQEWEIINAYTEADV